MLLTLVADYMRQQTLRERFDRSPDKVFDEYQVAKEDRKALREDPSLQELQRLLHRDVDQLDRGREYFPMWSPRGSELSGLLPTSGPINQDIPFTVTGSGFQQGAQLIFSNPAGENVHAGPSTVSTNGEKLTATAKFKNAGIYTASVQNPSGSPITSTQMFQAIPI